MEEKRLQFALLLFSRKSSPGHLYRFSQSLILSEKTPNPIEFGPPYTLISRDPTSTHNHRIFSDSRMKRICKLWKHASLVTSKNMAVAQLELLYDVMSTCINIHQNSFENLIQSLESVLRNIERSYQVTGAELQ
ncbi:hypothetical protein NQ317_008901 [Molorchus minor]|uniref:Uncharacterized protein n=1 Tax=Molorchus minor TaxID=1323400 RepID=A0ABQ9IXD2_9CUCU|nr:hypothetical protein NQ317_008901 [Molorchus minor]